MRCAGTTFISSTEAPVSTERSRAVTSSVETNRSLCLISSQFFASFVRTRANEPFTFSPRRRKDNFPFAFPFRVRFSACVRSWDQGRPSLVERRGLGRGGSLHVCEC